MGTKTLKVFSVGVYSASEAARLLDVHPSRIRRWLSGYTYKNYTGMHEKNPLWKTDWNEGNEVFEISFRDLMDLRLVKRFVQAGVSLQAIRKAILRASEILSSDRPLSNYRFKTDGKSVFLEIAQETEEPSLIDLVKSQYAFKKIIEQTFRDVDYENDAPVRWWLNESRTILIDPKRNYGQPIVVGGVSTETLVKAFEVERSYKRVADWYEIPMPVVRQAVALERHWAA